MTLRAIIFLVIVLHIFRSCGPEDRKPTPTIVVDKEPPPMEQPVEIVYPQPKTLEVVIPDPEDEKWAIPEHFPKPNKKSPLF